MKREYVIMVHGALAATQAQLAYVAMMSGIEMEE